MNQPGNAANADNTLDTATAISLLGGNTALYAQIARSFLEEIHALPQRLERLLRAPNPAEASRVLHSMKGLALTVGAQQLAEACRVGERQIKDARTDFLQQLRAEAVHTTLALQAALRSLDVTAQDPAAGCGAMTPAGTALQQDPSLLIAALQQLAALLAQSDMRAVDAHIQLRRTHSAAADERFDALNAAMRFFDFERGVVECEALLSGFATCNPQ